MNKYFQIKFIPTWLTLIRFLSPLVFPILFLFIFQFNYFSKSSGLIIFLIFSFSDFLDGFLARRYNLTTQLGAVLDPIGDKILVTTVLITLLHFHKVSLFVCLALILREVLVTSLRLVASKFNLDIKVSDVGKYKMLFQIIYISFVILDLSIFWYNLLKTLSGLIVVFLSYYSAFLYFKIFVKHFLSEDIK